jgi:hypothetical protein
MKNEPGKNMAFKFLTFWSTLGAVRLHCNMSIQMVERAIGFLATTPTTFVHALNLFVSPARTLVLLCTWNWDE